MKLKTTIYIHAYYQEWSTERPWVLTVNSCDMAQSGYIPLEIREIEVEVEEDPVLRIRMAKAYKEQAVSVLAQAQLEANALQDKAQKLLALPNAELLV